MECSVDSTFSRRMHGCSMGTLCPIMERAGFRSGCNGRSVDRHGPVRVLTGNPPLPADDCIPNGRMGASGSGPTIKSKIMGEGEYKMNYAVCSMTSRSQMCLLSTRAGSRNAFGWKTTPGGQRRNTCSPSISPLSRRTIARRVGRRHLANVLLCK